VFAGVSQQVSDQSMPQIDPLDALHHSHRVACKAGRRMRSTGDSRRSIVAAVRAGLPFQRPDAIHVADDALLSLLVPVEYPYDRPTQWRI